MLPEIGATELMVIAAVALIVVGPKDLPLLLRKVGQFVARLRGLANDFRSSFDEMARQSELDELRREVAAMRAGTLPNSINPLDSGETSKVFDEIDAGLNERPLYDPSVTQDYIPPDTLPEPAPAPKRARKAKAATPATTIEVVPEATKPKAKPQPKSAATTTAAKPKRTKA